jgi:hypothetical protein
MADPVVTSTPRLTFPDTQSLIAVSLTMSIIGLVFLLALTGQVNSDTFKILVGGLMSVGFTNVVGFYFGSSAGSKAKDESIATLVASVAPNGNGTTPH